MCIRDSLYKEIGAWLSGFIIKEFGIFPGLLPSLILFIWSLKFFNSSNINYFKTKLLMTFIMIFLSSLGGTYIENILINSLKLNFSIINQTGLSEWFLLYFSSGISEILGFDVSMSELLLGASSFIISIILFIWILSLDTAEIKFMKIITRPIVMPLSLIHI